MKLLVLAICVIGVCLAANSDPVKVPLDYQSGWTLATINVGTPPVKYRVGVTINDILGALMGNKMAGLENKTAYDPKKSSSANSTKGICNVNFDYGEQQGGNIVQEKLTLGGVTLDNFNFCNTDSAMIYMYNFSAVPADGMWSLGRESDFFTTSIIPLMKNFKQPVFTLYYSQKAKNYDTLQENAGQLTLGGLDTDHCGDFKYFDALDSFWSVKADVVKFNKKQYYPDKTTQGRLRFYTFSFESDYVTLPDDAVQAIKSFFYINGDRTAVHCDRVKDAPAITIRLSASGGGVEYDLLPSDYVEELTPGDCQLRIQKNTYFGDQQYAYWAAISLGTPFLRAYCVSFNTQTGQVGFAKVK